MAVDRPNQTSTHNPWSWHRIFLLFALTLVMILGFVVVGGGTAMMSECEETSTRRSVYLSDIVTKCSTKQELLHQLMTAWECDIPVDRLPPALAAVSGDLPRSCDSDLLTQLRHGGQGTLAAGVLLILASGGGYGGAISGRSGPLALYIVVSIVTAVLELAAVGVLVYNKSQLDNVQEQLDLLMEQQLVAPEVEVVVADAPGGILTAPGEVPTPASRPGGRRGGETGGGSPVGVASGERVGAVNATQTDTTSQGTMANSTASEVAVTDPSTAGVKNSPEDPLKTTKVSVNGTATSSQPLALTSSPSPASSERPPAAAATKAADAVEDADAVEAVQGRHAAVDESSHAETVPTQPSTSRSTSPSTSPSISTSNTTSSPTSFPGPTSSASDDIGAVEPERAVRRRRNSSEDWKESEEDWNDHTEEVIGHWSRAATVCLLQGAQQNYSHCFAQLEQKLQRELSQSELVLELMMAPLACAFLACLLQLTTIYSAWSMIHDQQTHHRHPAAVPEHQNTHQNTPV